MVKIRTVNKIFSLLFCILFLLSVSAVCFPSAQAFASEREYHRLVVLGDPHLPGENIAGKEAMVKDINRWNDVDMVVAVGDICQELGTRKEYAYARQFFGSVRKPVYLIPGNHDYIYSDRKNAKENRVKGSPSSRDAKLRSFQKTFGMPGLYYGKKIGNYQLLFLSTDDLHTKRLAGMSAIQLAWLRSALAEAKDIPTIVFFHAPLEGTLQNDNEDFGANNNFIAQPSDKLREILLANRQVYLWVSGHTHTLPINESFNAPVNLYEKQVTNIHSGTINHTTIWTNSLYLYSDKTVIKTYNHSKGVWMPSVERVIVPVNNR